MNSRLIRVLIVVIAIAIGLTASYLLKSIDSEITGQRASADMLRERAATLAASIAEVRSGQFAYVARGQGEAFWLSRVESLLPSLQKYATEFGASLTAPSARSTFEQTAAAVANIRTLDARVREFVQSGSTLLAADMIFSDGLESATTASASLAATLTEELQYRDGSMASLRSRQFAVLAGTAGALLLLMVGLVFVSAAPAKSPEPEVAAPAPIEPVRFEAPLPKARAAVTPKLLNTAQLCRELARVSESTALPSLLARAAKVLDASGIIVWVAEPSRQTLVPAIAHGYESRTVARMGAIHRDANNAAAAAYRASEVRTVAGDSITSGALIVPLLTSDGCVGVLSAEMRGGGEKDESSQALASIFAAQLATLVATPSAVPVRAVAQA